MAIKELQSLVVETFPTAADTTFYAGMVLARDSDGADAGLVRAADRAADTIAEYVGFAYDDHARTGCTMIQPDPVGSTYIDPDTGAFEAYNNGWFVGPKRVLGDWFDEPVTNVTNLTAGASGYQGPRRGVSVLISPSGRFVTDQFAAVATSTATADSGTPIVFAINDRLTFGAGANAGLLVKIDEAADGPAIAKVDSYDAAAGLLYITQLQ